MTNNNQNSENFDRIDTGELAIVHPDQIADVTDESVAEETLVINAELEAEAIAEQEEPHVHETVADVVIDDDYPVDETVEEVVEDVIEAETAEDLVDEVSEYNFVPVALPHIRRGFRGYNVDDIDSFVIPLLEEHNELRKDFKELTEANALLLEQVEENKKSIESLRHFNITDEVQTILKDAHANTKVIVADAEARAKEIIAEGKLKAKEARDGVIAHKKEAIEKAREKAHEVAEQSKHVKEAAKLEAKEIIEKAKLEAKEIISKTNSELSEAKEYIAKRHEVHNSLQEFYKAQSDFLSNRG